MSHVPTGPGSWQASDGLWYPYESHPYFTQLPTPPVQQLPPPPSFAHLPPPPDQPLPPSSTKYVPVHQVQQAPPIQVGQPLPPLGITPGAAMANPPMASTSNPALAPPPGWTPPVTRAGASERRYYEECRARDKAKRRARLPMDIAFVVVAGLLAYLGVRLGAHYVNVALSHISKQASPSSSVKSTPAFSSSLANVIGLLVGVLAAFGMGKNLWTSNPETEAHRKGAEGEEAVGAQLDTLRPQGFVVFHDMGIPGSNANVDHLVIGPTGIFMVDAKVRNNKVNLSNQDKLFSGGNMVRTKTTAGEAKAVEKALRGVLPNRMPVQAVMCFVDSALPRLDHPIDGVRIVSMRKGLLPFITAQPPVLGFDSVMQIAYVAFQTLGIHQ